MSEQSARLPIPFRELHARVAGHLGLEPAGIPAEHMLAYFEERLRSCGIRDVRQYLPSANSLNRAWDIALIREITSG